MSTTITMRNVSFSLLWVGAVLYQWTCHVTQYMLTLLIEDCCRLILSQSITDIFLPIYFMYFDSVVIFLIQLRLLKHFVSTWTYALVLYCLVGATTSMLYMCMRLIKTSWRGLLFNPTMLWSCVHLIRRIDIRPCSDEHWDNASIA